MSTLTATIQADTSGFNNAVEKARKELDNFNKSNKNVEKEANKVKLATKAQVNAFKKSVSALEKVANGEKTAKQSTKILKEEIEKLNKQWKNLSNAAKSSDFGKAMDAAIKSAKSELASLDVELINSTDNVKKFGNSLGESINVNAFNLSNITNVITNVGNIYTKVAEMVVALTNKLEVNESVLDSWGRTAEGLSSVGDSFFRMLAGNEHMSNVFYAYRLGKNKYDAEDDLSSFYANDAEWYAEILVQIQDLKTRKKDGQGATQAEVDKLKKEIDDYYDCAESYIEQRNKSYENEVIGDKDGKFYNPHRKELLDKYLKAKDANGVINEWKNEMKGYNLEEIQDEMFYMNPFSDEYNKLQEKRDAILDPKSRYSALKSLIEMETSHLQKLKQNNVDLKNVKRERLQLEGEVLKAKQNPTKEKREKVEKLENSEMIPSIEGYRKRIKMLKEIMESETDPEWIRAYAQSIKTLEEGLEELELNTKTAKLEGIDMNRAMKQMHDKYKDTSAKDRLDSITMEMNAVNSLAGAWNNLFSCINMGNNKTSQGIQALGSTVQNFANMYVQLQKIQFEASEAVALGKANASASGLPFPYNLAAMATVTAAIMSSFASFASIGKFADGGIVGGSGLSGDRQIARVNSGEMILNGTQQKKLFNMLNGNSNIDNSGSSSNVHFRIEGKDLVGVLDNYSKKINRVR